MYIKVTAIEYLYANSPHYLIPLHTVVDTDGATATQTSPLCVNKTEIEDGE